MDVAGSLSSLSSFTMGTNPGEKNKHPKAPVRTASKFNQRTASLSTVYEPGGFIKGGKKPGTGMRRTVSAPSLLAITGEDARKEDVRGAEAAPQEATTDTVSAGPTARTAKAPLFTITDGFNPTYHGSAEEALRELLPVKPVDCPPLGSGSFGVVEKWHKTDDQYRLAIKFTFDTKMNRPSVSLTQGEVCALEIPPHPNLAKTHAILVKHKEQNQYCIIKNASEVPEDQKKLYFAKAIISDRLPGEELYEYLSLVVLSKEEIIPVFKQITSALTHLENHAFIHRDLKISNVMYDSGSNTACLIDFGFTKKIDQQGTDSPVGTKIYLSPEIWNSHLKKYGHECDHWLLGCLFMICLTGKYPCRYNESTNTLEDLPGRPKRKKTGQVMINTLSFARLNDDEKKKLIESSMHRELEGIAPELLDITVQLLRFNKAERLNFQDAEKKLLALSQP